MPRDYKKAQRERDKKKRGTVRKGTKSSETTASSKPSGTLHGTKSSHQKTYLEKTNDRAALIGRSPIMFGFGPKSTVSHPPVPAPQPIKPKQASPIKGRDIPLPKSKF